MLHPKAVVAAGATSEPGATVVNEPPYATHARSVDQERAPQATERRGEARAHASRPVIWLLGAQGFLTAITGLILLVVPEVIPAAFGLSLTRDAHLLCYFYAAGELSLTFFSFAAIRLAAGSTLRLCCVYFAFAHSAQGLVGIYAVAQGLPTKVIANSVAHLIIAALFAVVASNARFGALASPSKSM